jgi:hypothetical protein
MPAFHLALWFFLSFSSDVVADRIEDEIHIIAQMPMLETNTSALVSHSISASDLDGSKSADLTDYLHSNTPSVTINSAQNNPLQPDLQLQGV